MYWRDKSCIEEKEAEKEPRKRAEKKSRQKKPTKNTCENRYHNFRTINFQKSDFQIPHSTFRLHAHSTVQIQFLKIQFPNYRSIISAFQNQQIQIRQINFSKITNHKNQFQKFSGPNFSPPIFFSAFLKIKSKKKEKRKKSRKKGEPFFCVHTFWKIFSVSLTRQDQISALPNSWSGTFNFRNRKIPNPDSAHLDSPDHFSKIAIQKNRIKNCAEWKRRKPGVAPGARSSGCCVRWLSCRKFCDEWIR